MKYITHYCKNHWFIFGALLLLTVAVISCRKDEKFITSSEAKLAFSTDTSAGTLTFDTVFTSVGSATLN